jgi:acyl-CoA hydrolase
MFRQPIHVGELVAFLASVNHTDSSSMEIGIKVIAEAIRAGGTLVQNCAGRCAVRWNSGLLRFVPVLK